MFALALFKIKMSPSGPLSAKLNASMKAAEEQAVPEEV